MVTGRTISIRLGLDGALELKQQLQDAGVTGGAALDGLSASLAKLGAQNTSGLEAALDRVNAKLAQTTAAVGQAQANSFANVQSPISDTDYAKQAVAYQVLGQQIDAVKAKYITGFAASKQYEAGLAEVADAERTGILTSGQAALARDKLTSSFAAANAPTLAGAATMREATAAHGGFSLATAGATRELIVLGHEVVSGNYNRIPGSLIVMAERAGGLHDILGTVGSTLTSTGGIFGIVAAAGVAALGALAYGAETADRRMLDLGTHLRVTRADYQALAAASEATARAVASTSTIGVGDARAAYGTLTAIPNFSGTTEQFKDLIRLSGDVAAAFGIDVPKAAEKLAQDLANPTAAAKKLADEGFGGMDQAAARVIERLQAQGNLTAAQAAIVDAYTRALGGAAKDGATPLQKAMTDLGNAFTATGANGKSFAHEIGEFVTGEVTFFLLQITELIKAAQKLRDFVGSASPSITSPVVDSDGKVPNASADLQRVAPQTAQAIYRIAEANNIPAQIADLGTRIAYQESRGQQIDPHTGSILTSSAGALGIGQLLPATARDMGVDPTSADGNVLGMLRYLVQLSQNPSFKTEADIAAAYNAGPGRYGDYLAGKGAPLRPETVQYVQNVAGQSIPASLAPGATGQATSPSKAAQGASVGLTASGLPQSVNDVLKLPDNTVGRTQEDLDDKIAAYVRAIGDLDAAGTKSGPIMDDLQARLAKVRGEYTNAIPAVDASTRAVTDSLAPLSATTGAARVLAEAQNQLTLAARAAGADVTPEQRAAREAAEYGKLNAAYQDTLAGIGRQIEAQGRLAPAYDAGAKSVIEATNATKAAEDARAYAVPGTQAYADKVAGLTAAYNALTASQVDNATRAKSFDQRDQLTLLQAETAALGQNQDAATKQIDLLKEKQDLVKRGADLQSAASQADLANVAAIADATAAYQHQKESLSELTGFVDNTFSTISSSITQAFAIGSKTAVDFGSIVKGVVSAIEAEFIKLAAINPLKDALFGTTSPNLSSVGGILGNLFGSGSGSTLSTDSASSWVIGGAGLAVGEVFDRNGNSVPKSEFTDTDVQGKTGTLGATGNISITSAAGYASTAFKALDFVSGGKLLDGVKSYVFDAVGYTPGSSIGSWVSSLVGESVGASAAGLGADAASFAAAGVASGVGSAGIAAATTAANVVGGAATGAVGTIGAAASSIAGALPAIGAAVTVVTDLIQGNYRGAALVTAGALIGTAIAPGIGTAVGAALGAVVDLILPNHPKNPYQNTAVTVDDAGHIVAGKQVSQIEKTGEAAQSVTDFGDALGAYLDQVKVDITNRGTIGNLGNGIKGLTQVTNVADLFPNLHFANDPSDTSNFGVAKGALAGLTFKDINGLNDELVKIGRFSDGMDQLGIKLAAVGTDLTGISIASVSLTGALDAQGNAVVAAATPGPNGLADIGGTTPDPLRVALSHDLPGQTFANVDALSAEIDKVATFVTQTMPGLLNPVVASAVSSLQQQIAATNEKYRVAQDTAAKYGLDTQPLYDAETKADSLLIAPARKQLDQQSTAISDRYTVATTGASLGTTLDAFDTSADQQRDALIKSMTDTYGDTVKQTQYYNDQIANLEQTLGAERLKTAQQYAEQEAAALLNVQATIGGVTARQDTLNGDDRDAELTTYDIKAAQEQASFSKTLTDFYGASYTTTADYQQQMTALETVEQGERLAIVKKYGDQTSAAMAQALSQAQGNVTSLYASLGSYATKLETGSNSPLSAQDQYTLAARQFQAVSGAASAGDYTSASQLQSFSDTFLAASRVVNGSGAGYATDFQSVLSALQSVTTVSDALTASAQRQIAQDQADRLIAAQQDATTQLSADLTALRREVQLLGIKMAS